MLRAWICALPRRRAGKLWTSLLGRGSRFARRHSLLDCRGLLPLCTILEPSFWTKLGRTSSYTELCSKLVYLVIPSPKRPRCVLCPVSQTCTAAGLLLNSLYSKIIPCCYCCALLATAALVFLATMRLSFVWCKQCVHGSMFFWLHDVLFAYSLYVQLHLLFMIPVAENVPPRRDYTGIALLFYRQSSFFPGPGVTCCTS